MGEQLLPAGESYIYAHRGQHDGTVTLSSRHSPLTITHRHLTPLTRRSPRLSRGSITIVDVIANIVIDLIPPNFLYSPLQKPVFPTTPNQFHSLS